MAKKPASMKIHPGPGFRIQNNIERADNSIVAQYGSFDSADISDILNRLYTMSSDIHNLVDDTKIVGSVVTVKVYPGDNLMVHKALDIAKPGDIVVVDASESYVNAVMGDLIASKAKIRGIQGFVVDGLVRDLEGLKEVGLPIFAKGVTAVGPLHRGPGEINFPISCGGIVIKPGDIVVGDTSGVVVVRKEFSEEILERLYKQKESLKDYLAALKKGVFSNEWVDDILNDGDCNFYD